MQTTRQPPNFLPCIYNRGGREKVKGLMEANQLNKLNSWCWQNPANQSEKKFGNKINVLGNSSKGARIYLLSPKARVCVRVYIATRSSWMCTHSPSPHPTNQTSCMHMYTHLKDQSKQVKGRHWTPWLPQSHIRKPHLATTQQVHCSYCMYMYMYMYM